MIGDNGDSGDGGPDVGRFGQCGHQKIDIPDVVISVLSILNIEIVLYDYACTSQTYLVLACCCVSKRGLSINQSSELWV